MKKLTVILLSAAMLTVLIYAQANNQDNAEKYKESATTGQIDIQVIPVEDFDDASSWMGMMPRDMGIIRVQRREGGPAEVKEMEKNKEKPYCLGAKVAFFKTGANWFAMSPPKEMHIKGVTKELQMWVCGRNRNHKISAVVRDIQYRLFKVVFGKLAFPGWQQMKAQVSYRIDQENFKYITFDNPRGIKLTSILVECAMDETHGIYYLYLDELTARSDVFMENPENYDPHDMLDNW